MLNIKTKWIASALIVLTACLLTVTPTMSWMTSTSPTVVNTFTSGAVMITLDEAEVNLQGEPTGNRTLQNEYLYLAGAELTKDPTVTVLAGSQESYVFMYVDNELPDTFGIDYQEDNWVLVAKEGTDSLWMYLGRPDTSQSSEDLVLTPLFTTVTVPKTFTEKDAEELGERTVSVTAFAIQTKGLTVSEAISEALAKFMPDAAIITVPNV